MALGESTSQSLNLNRADAAKLLRNAKTGSRFYLSAIVHLPIADKPGQVFETISSVKTTRKEALRFVDCALSETMESRGALINIRVNHYEGDAGSFYHVG